MNSKDKTTYMVYPEVLSRTLRLRLSHAAMLESLMEVQRLWLEKGGVPLMKLWLSEFIALHQKTGDILKLTVTAKTEPEEIQSVFLDQLKSSQSALDEASTEFNRAYYQQNQALLVRWLEEYRVHRANLGQLAEKWLEDHPE